MNNNKLYLIANNDKKFAAWCKEKRKKLNTMVIAHFNNAAQDVRYANYFARASFICYWEIQVNGSLAKLAPAITQATLISMMHKLLALDKKEEAEVVSLMMTNFLRLLQRLDDEEE